MPPRRLRTALALAAAAALPATGFAAGCSDGGSGPALSPEAERGRSVYRANCTSCHALVPTREGGMGPAVAGSSLELLRAKVLRGEYPLGYEPKRDSSAMPRLPHLEDRLPALAAYLEAVAETKTAAPPAESAAVRP